MSKMEFCTDKVDLKSKYTLTCTDIQQIIGCGKNKSYSLIEDAIINSLFTVKKLGKKYFIPAESFWTWYNSPDSSSHISNL